MAIILSSSNAGRYNRTHQRLFWLVLIMSASGFTAGCERKSEGPSRFSLSGTITYKGVPIPVGELQFSPDTRKGNSGPGAIAKIKDGHYETYAGKGTVGGPMRIHLNGFNGKPVKIGNEVYDDGMPLFDPFEVEVDLPMNAGAWDYDVTKPPSREAQALKKK